MTGEWIDAGVVGVDSGQLLVTDPCYLDNLWVDEPMNVPRTIHALNEEGLAKFPGNEDWRWQFSMDAVDGELVRPNGTYATPIEKFDGYSVNDLIDLGYIRDIEPEMPPGTSYSYNGACRATLSEQGYGQLNYPLGHAGAGVAFRSGWGDGVYQVKVRKNEEGRIVEARILMDDEEERPGLTTLELIEQVRASTDRPFMLVILEESATKTALAAGGTMPDEMFATAIEVMSNQAKISTSDPAEFLAKLDEEG